MAIPLMTDTHRQTIATVWNKFLHKHLSNTLWQEQLTQLKIFGICTSFV